MPPKHSTQNESVRLFDSDFLELFTRVPWYVPLVLYVPLVGFCVISTLKDPLTTAQTFLLSFMIGILFWSLMEYFLHRHLFHWKPKSKIGKKAMYLVHEIHHEYPHDRLRLVMPPIVSILYAVILFPGFYFLIPAPYFYPFFAGLVTGYLSYDMIHFSAHHLPMKSRVGSFIREHHLRHHFQNEKKGFGVSSPLWDWIFRT